MSLSRKTPATSLAAHERGVAHVKRGEYPKAIDAFTEAIRLDPGAASAYLGRALAYRKLGDTALAVHDERKARALGEAVRSAREQLLKRAYERWRADLRDSAWARDDPLSRDAFLLHQWTWQIYNGGLPQWVANGYGECADDLACAAERVGTDAARAVAAVVRDVAGVLTRCPGAREAMFRMIAAGSELTGPEDELFRELSRCEDWYYRVVQAPGGRSFAADVERWLDARAAEAP
jgi:tetratricopeptide (TPR) repeat protein